MATRISIQQHKLWQFPALCHVCVFLYLQKTQRKISANQEKGKLKTIINIPYCPIC